MAKNILRYKKKLLQRWNRGKYVVLRVGLHHDYGEYQREYTQNEESGSKDPMLSQFHLCELHLNFSSASITLKET